MVNPLSFLHTSDWHLGKKLFKESRLEEQQHFLQWLLLEGKRLNPDVLIIAGDIFDSPIPPTEALEAYFNFLKEWTNQNPKSAIIITAGNHDSGHFLEAPKSWLKDKNVHVFGYLAEHQVVSINKNGIDYNFHSFPYFRSSEVYKIVKNFPGFDEQQWEDDDNYAVSLLEQIFQQDIKPGKNILISHHAFGPFSSSKSEQVISFAGSSSIPVSVYKEHYDYIALGHIHKFQKIGSNPPAYYPGSPIPFRFSESNDKFIIHGEFCQDGLKLTPLKIPLLKLLYHVELSDKNIHSQLQQKKDELLALNCPIFLMVRINLSQPLYKTNNDIEEVFKNSNITVLSTQLIFTQDVGSSDAIHNDIYSGDIASTFKHYYTQKTGCEKIPEHLEIEFNNLLNTISGHDES